MPNFIDLVRPIGRIDRPLSRLARPAKREFDHLGVGRSAGDGPRMTSGRIFCGKPASRLPENAPVASWSHARALAGNAWMSHNRAQDATTDARQRSETM